MIEFIEESHTYLYDGEIVPSVSEIMKGISSYYYTKDIPEIALELACKKGTAVHNAIEQLLIDGVYSIEGQYDEYVERFKEWREEYNPKILYIEKVLSNGKYAGTIDLICEINGLNYIVDYKTSSKLHEKLVSVQLTGYEELCDYNKIIIDKRYALHLKKDGYEFVELEDKHKIWNNLIENYEYMEENNE